MKLTCAFFALCAGVCLAQQAKVIQIEDGDAKAMELAQAALAQAQQSVKQWEQNIQDKYLTVNENDPERGNTILSASDLITGTSSAGVLLFSGSSGTVRSDFPVIQIDGKCMGIVDDKLQVVPCEPVKSEPPDPCRLSRESSACLKQRLAEAIEAEKNPPPKPHYKYRRAGWDNGFEFTKDYKFIVPKQAVPNYPSQNGIQLTPGFVPYASGTAVPVYSGTSCGGDLPPCMNISNMSTTSQGATSSQNHTRLDFK